MNDLAHKLLRIGLHRRTRSVVAWLIALIWAGCVFYFSWIAFDAAPWESARADGNSGHTHIDFGGQWLMGAMLAQGRGQHLYNRNDQWQVIQQAYPRADEVPVAQRTPELLNAHDAEQLIGSLMDLSDPRTAKTVATFVLPLAAADALGAAALLAAGQEEWTPENLEQAGTRPVGGPLYPPINALYYYPLGLLRPQAAYRTFQGIGILLTFLAAFGLRQLSQGRVWWPVAVVFLLVYPAFSNNLKLGQNAIVTLTILIWGWTLIAGDRPGWGGVVWGLLAFKPVWAAAFFLVPLLTRRWRVCLSMIATGTLLAATTLPFVGWHSWLDWLAIGREAAVLYNADVNWVFLSRDLLGIPRRFLIDFQLPLQLRDNPGATWMSWSGLAVAIFLTVSLSLVRRWQAHAVTGPVAAFLLLGAWMSCFHFMYYDVLLSALPVFLLFTEPWSYLEPILLTIRPWSIQQPDLAIVEHYRPSLALKAPPPALLIDGARRYWVVNRMILNLFVLLLCIEYLFPMLGVRVYLDGQPWDTYCLIVIWLWCGWLWLRQPNVHSSAACNFALSPKRLTAHVG